MFSPVARRHNYIRPGARSVQKKRNGRTDHPPRTPLLMLPGAPPSLCTYALLVCLFLSRLYVVSAQIPIQFIPGGVKYIAPKSACRTVPADVPYCGGMSSTASEAHIQAMSAILRRGPIELQVIFSPGSTAVVDNRSPCSGSEQCVKSYMRLLCTSLNGWYVGKWAHANAPWAEHLHHVPPSTATWGRLKNDVVRTNLRSVYHPSSAYGEGEATDDRGEFLLPADARNARYVVWQK